MTDNKVFWMVYVEGMGGPSVPHSRMSEARIEAERLCRQENRRVFILKAELYVKVESQFMWCLLDKGDEDMKKGP